MKRTAAAWGVILAAGLLLGGCNKDQTTGPGEQTPAGVNDELTAMKYQAENDPFVTNDEVTFADKAVEAEDYGTFGKIDASIIPVRFGRFINSVERTATATVLPGDTLSVVNVKKTIHGTFAILAKLHPTDTTFTLVQKPFVDQSSRNIIFKRINRSGALMERWVAVATSLVSGGTAAPNDKVQITQLQLFTPTDTVTVTNPDTTFLRYRWLTWYGRRLQVPVAVGGQRFTLQATVRSASADTDIVALRFGFVGLMRRRIHMTLVSQTSNGDGTFTRVYETPSLLYMHFHTGFFTMGVDAMTRGTIVDDQAPYSASFWGVPYRVL